MRKQQALGILAAAALLAGGFFFINRQETKETLRVNSTSSCMMQMYALDEQNTLIPLSIPCEEKDHMKKRLQQLVAKMSKKQGEGLLPVFAKDTKLEDAVLVDQTLTLQFNEAFLNYEKEHELRVLEAIAWLGTQFEGVAQVQIAIGDDTLQTMPNGTPIPAVLNRKIGINNFLTSTSALHDSDAMTVFYTKEVMDKTFYVPKTKRVSANLSDVDAYIDAILADVSVNSSLKQPLAQEKVKTTAASVMRENVLQVHLDNRILAEDQTAKKQAYETLILSLCMLDQVEQVQVLVDDVAVTLHGMNDRSCSAAELIYNEIE